MKNPIWFLCVGLLPCLGTSRSAPAAYCQTRFAGAWEYRQAAGKGLDAEGERLELTCSRNGLRGLYYGLEREGEEGLFYTLVEVRKLAITGSDIAFVVPEREMFAQRPESMESVMRDPLPSSGVTRDELVFQGRLEHERLVFSCTSKMGTCPAKTMVFNRGD